MKKIILSIVIALYSFNYGLAQFAFGINAGMNISNVNNNFNDELFNQGKLLNLMAGIAPQFIIRDKIILTLNLQYSPKGLKLVETNNISKFRYTYLDLLPEVEYKISEKFRTGIGMNYGFLIEEENNINGQGWRSIKHLGNTNSKDFGITLKLQFHIKDAYIYLRYNHGLGDLTDIDFVDMNGEVIQEINQYNKNIQIGIGYLVISKSNEHSH